MRVTGTTFESRRLHSKARRYAPSTPMDEVFICSDGTCGHVTSRQKNAPSRGSLQP